MPEAQFTANVAIDVEGYQSVSGLLVRPPDAVACYVMAHGAGAGMDHSFMTACAIGLAELGIATLRFQFPYMQRGSRRPDAPKTCHVTVRAAVEYAKALRPPLPLIAGGRSFGGRMASQAQAIEAMSAGFERRQCPSTARSASESPAAPQQTVACLHNDAPRA